VGKDREEKAERLKLKENEESKNHHYSK